MFNYYEEQPGSPLVEWFRYAKRRSKDLQQLPNRLTEQFVSTLVTFLLILVIVGKTQALDKLAFLLISLLASVLIVPTTKFLFHLINARHALLKEENSRLTRDNAALSEAVTTLEATVAALRPLSAEVAPEGLKVQEHGFAVVAPFFEAVGREGARRLAALRERAIHDLLNRRIRNENELEALKRDISTWEREVLQDLEQYAGVDEITRFRVLGTYSIRGTGGINAEHNAELAMLVERLNRVEAVIARLAAYA